MVSIHPDGDLNVVVLQLFTDVGLRRSAEREPAGV
jgi:hypothetical protein